MNCTLIIVGFLYYLLLMVLIFVKGYFEIQFYKKIMEEKCFSGSGGEIAGKLRDY